MIILGIDPGPRESAALLWDGERIVSMCILPNEELLQRFQQPESNEVLMAADSLAIEMIEGMGMPVGKEVFETCLWIGRFIQAWAGRKWLLNYRKPWRLVYRKSDVKMHLCHSVRATDANIKQALIDKVGEVGKKKTPGPLYGVKQHLWAALAVAVTAHEQAHRSPIPPASSAS